MSAFFVKDNEGKRLYVESIDKANESITWTDDPQNGVYRNTSGFYADADFDFIKFHFKDKYPYIDTLEEDEGY